MVIFDLSLFEINIQTRFKIFLSLKTKRNQKMHRFIAKEETLIKEHKIKRKIILNLLCLIYWNLYPNLNGKILCIQNPEAEEESDLTQPSSKKVASK